MKKYYLGLDIGGSHISAAFVDNITGQIADDNIYDRKIDSKGTADEIISGWQSAIQDMLNTVSEDAVLGIGVAIPGPFDYQNGISKIEGVQKFESIFGLNVKQAFRKVFPDESKPIIFNNDATGFALGEYFSGAAKNSKKTILLALGTGFGSTFLIDGIPQTVAGNGIPENGYLYNIPFGDKIADDCFSTRWFASAYNQKSGIEVKGVKEVAVSARNNDKHALAIFDEFANNLADFMTPWFFDFQPDVLIIGGNIAKSEDLFLDKLKTNLANKGFKHIEIKIAQLEDKAPIVGAAMAIKQQTDNIIKEKADVKRKTTQFLMPEKATPTTQGTYDIYPGFPIGNGKIKQGSEGLASWIMLHKTVVIDGYVGVFWNDFVKNIDAELRKAGKKASWFHVEAAMHSPEYIAEMLKPYMGEEDSIFGKVTDKSLIDWFDADKLKEIKPDKDSDINIIIGCGATLAGWNGPLIYVDLPKNELQFRMRAGKAFNLGADKTEDNRIMYKRFYFADWIVLNHHKCSVLPSIDLIVDEQRPDDYLYMSGDDLRKGLSSMGQNLFRVRPWFEPGAWGGSLMKEKIEGLNKDVPNLAWSFELMVLENGLLFDSDGYRLEVSFDFLMFNSYKDVLGDCAERFKYDFPIRFDFLDTFDGGNLSVQCHPRPEYIKEEFGMPFTQDETYYILDCKNEPHVYLGFQEDIDPEEFHNALKTSEATAKEIDIEKYVQKFDAKKHDLYLIPNGTIHASGKDNFVLEISSAPYIFTFKMYDWVRLDLDGRPRPINIDHGMKNVNFERKGKLVEEELISHPTIIQQTQDYTLEKLPTHAEHFYDIYRYSFDEEITMENNNKCHVWMMVEGNSVTIETKNGMVHNFNYAETFVIPAAAESYRIKNNGKEKAMMVMSLVR